MIKLTNQRDPGSVRELPMRNGFSIKPKNKEATKLLTPQNIIQEFQKFKVKVQIKIYEKTRENIRKTIMEDVTKVLCEILKDNKITVDEVKMRHKLNKLSKNRTKNQNTQQ